jgi:phage/plasmid-like protein (TIGR03299 family)
MPAAVDTMAYAGETPWHGLGTKIPSTASVDEVLVAAGLDWAAKLAPVFFTPEGATEPRTTGDRALYRGDTGAVLDTVGAQYVPVQNSEVLEFFRAYVDAGAAEMETAGALLGGRWIWALAKLKDGYKVGKGDEVEGRVLLANPHLYGKGLRVKLTETRVVCWNTFTAALAGAGAEVKLWHNRPFDDDVRQVAAERLDLARATLKQQAAEARQLAKTKLTDAAALALAAELLGGDPKQKDVAEQPKHVRRVMALFQGEGKGAALPSAAGTAWGLFNAVTQFTDWEYGKTQDARVARSWLGGGEVVKRRARTRLLQEAA